LTQPSRRFTIWERLAERFLIEPIPVGVSDSPSVSTMIQPTTNADELLRVPMATAQLNQDIQASASFFSLYTTAAGKRTHFKHAHRELTSAQTQLAVRYGGSGGVLSYLTVLDQSEQVWDGNIILDEGDQFGIITTGNAGDSSRDIDFIYELEDLF